MYWCPKASNKLSASIWQDSFWNIVQAYYEINIDFRIALSWIGSVDRNEMSGLGSRFTTTQMESCFPGVRGNLTMKSMLMSSHFHAGIDNSCICPTVFRCLALILWHVSQPYTYSANSPFMFDHQKISLGSRYILVLRTMCGSRTGGWSLPGVMSDWQHCVDWFLAKYCRCRLRLD
jgi:hypothetical protein